MLIDWWQNTFSKTKTQKKKIWAYMPNKMSASSFLEGSQWIDWTWAKFAVKDARFLGSFEAMFWGSVFYLVLMSVLSFLMRERRESKRFFNLRIPSILHNLFMTVYSFWGFLGVSYQLWHNLKVIKKEKKREKKSKWKKKNK